MKLNIQTANERSVIFEKELNEIFVINFKLGVVLWKVLGNLESYFGVFAKLRNVSWCLSIRPSAWNNSLLTGRIFMKCDIYFSENLSRKFKFH